MDKDKLLIKKKKVEEIGKVISTYVDNVQEIKYEIYQHKESSDKYAEYLKIIFVGNGYLVRSCAGNSISAIVKEIGKYLNGGYYDEVEYYNTIIKVGYDEIK